MSELDRALDQIQTGQINQGIENWERCFHGIRGQLSPTDVLFLQADLAQVLVDIGLVKDAKNIDQHILDQLSEDEDNEYQLFSPEDRAKLDKEIQARYAKKASRSGVAVKNGSSDNGENREQPGLISTVTHKVDQSLLSQDKDSKDEVQPVIEDVEARTRAATSDEARRPTLLEERMGDTSRTAE